MEFPINVSAIEFNEVSTPISEGRFFRGSAGSWVAVRPVGDQKTYLGILLGDYYPPAVTYDPATGVLTVGHEFLGNPAMWIPDLKQVVMGWGSWWGPIEKEEDLRQITDADIQNQWYVKALKELSDAKTPDE